MIMMFIWWMIMIFVWRYLINLNNTRSTWDCSGRSLNRSPAARCVSFSFSFSFKSHAKNSRGIPESLSHLTIIYLQEMKSNQRSSTFETFDVLLTRRGTLVISPNRDTANLNILYRCLPNSKPSAPDDKWWKSATIHQVYPSPFKDSNSSGIGDLNGIEVGLFERPWY